MKKSKDLKKTIGSFFVTEIIIGLVCFYFLSPRSLLYFGLVTVTVIELFTIAVVSGFVIVIINNKFELWPINDCKVSKGRTISTFLAVGLFLFLFFLLQDFIPYRDLFTLGWLVAMNAYLMGTILCYSESFKKEGTKT